MVTISTELQHGDIKEAQAELPSENTSPLSRFLKAHSNSKYADLDLKLDGILAKRAQNQQKNAESLDWDAQAD